MIRVVLDTNIIISAHLKPGSLPDAVLNLALNGFVGFNVSDEVLAEYEEVLSRPRLRIDPATVLDVVAPKNIPRSAFRSVPIRMTICFWNARAGADFLITGNLRDFPSVWENTRIISVREFFEWIWRSPSA